MAIGQRISALHKRHEWLDQVLEKEMSHPHPDEIRMMQIKKSKLRVKDEIAALEGMHYQMAHAASSHDMMDYRRRAAG
jgi:hypothetical protein